MGAPKQQKKKGGGGKKLGRNKVRCAAYRSSGKRETNHRKNIMRFLKAVVKKALRQGKFSADFITKVIAGSVHRSQRPNTIEINPMALKRDAMEYAGRFKRWGQNEKCARKMQCMREDV